MARAAEPVLQAGEVVEVATVATFGRTNIVKAAAFAAATGLATGGLLIGLAYARKVPIVLTNRRLLVLGIKGILFERADSKIVTALPRSELRAKPPYQRLLWTNLDLTDAQGRSIARMQFPIPNRGHADQIAQLLGEPPPSLAWR